MQEMRDKSITGDVEAYDQDYYENGIATGKSCYENYRWIPELTIPMAMTLIDHLDISRTDKILDYGCSKGFLVKALRILHRNAWGVDCSRYAVANADSGVAQYIGLTSPDFRITFPKNGYQLPPVFDYCIAKDVFEHIPVEVLVKVLRTLPAVNLFVVVPLGNGERYNIPVFHMDITHIHWESMEWWESFFRECGWEVIEKTYRIEGIKDHWSHYEDGHGFFVLKNRIVM